MSVRWLSFSLLLVMLAATMQGCTLLNTIFGAIGRICERDLAVTTFVDKNDGVCTPDDCSLREAVVTSNECAGTQTIRLPIGRFELSLAGRGEDAAATGDLDLTDDVFIIGDSALRPEPRVEIDGAGIDRLFELQPLVEVAFEGLQLVNGDSDNQPGGAVFAGEGSSLTLLGVHVVGNQATDQGGGVYSAGQVRIEDGVFEENVVSQGGASSGIFGGGAVFVDHIGSAVIERSTFQANRATEMLSSGGALNLRGPATIRESDFLNNESASRGGGIESRDDLSLDLVRFEGNTAGGSGGGIIHSGGAANLSIENGRFIRNMADHGGGLHTWGPTTIYATSFVGNTARERGGGIYVAGWRAEPSGEIVENDFPVAIEASSFTENTAGRAAGSAIHNLTGSVVLDEINVERNQAALGGAAIYSEQRLDMDSSTVLNNMTTQFGYAVRNLDGEMAIRRTRIAGNTLAPAGGRVEQIIAIANDGTLVMNTVEILDNSAPAGGYGSGLQNETSGDGVSSAVLLGVRISGHDGRAIYNEYPGSSLFLLASSLSGNPGGAIANGGEMLVRGSAIHGNTASRLEYGPASCSIINNFGGLEIENSTISGNVGSASDCRTILNDGHLRFEHATVYDNLLVGLHSEDLFTTATPIHVEAVQTILAGNDGNCTAAITSLGWNLFDDASCGPDASLLDIVSTSLGLDPLADNGGPSQTHALVAGSPAIDGAGATCLAVDQRGFVRPAGAACDIGSFEAGATPGRPGAPILERLEEESEESDEPEAEGVSINFNADAYSLPLGECTTLRWAVENADLVMLDGEEVLPTEAEQVCPPATTSYQLTASNAIESAEAFVTIEVIQPIVEPPSAPGQFGASEQQCNANGYVVSLSWFDTADNEDGFRVYRDGNLIATLGANANQYSDNSAPASGSPVTYGVEAFNDAGASSRPTAQEDGCLF